MQWKEFRTALRPFPPKEEERVLQAFDLCIHAHEGQTRRSGEPYSSHPIAVARILAEMGADPDTVIAALLHDTLEDTALPLESIRDRFGSTTATMIEGLTKLESEDMLEHPTLDQEIESLRKIVTLMQEDVRIMVIRIADRMHNMKTIRFLLPERQISFAQETMDVYVKIAERMGMQDISEELESLSLAVLDPQLFARLEEARAANIRWGEEVAQEMRAVLYNEPFPLRASVILFPESKTWEHLRARLGTEEAAVSGSSDLTMVLLCENIAQCYEALGILHQQWPHEILSFKDFINAPAVNGYRGLHTTVILRDGTRVRCKIRTRDMHAYARKGVTTLCFDHRAVGLLDSLPWMERIAPLSRDTRDVSKEFWDSLQSDILGKSTLIYGPDDSKVQLPAGATALDGAFYLFHEKALRTKTIRVNGKDVPFFIPLTHGAAMEIETHPERTVQREWLLWVKTGFAVALIRKSLAEQSDHQKIITGRELLQKALNDRWLGYFEEFDQQAIEEKLRPLGYPSLHEAFLAMADGHLDPTAVVSSVISTRRKQHSPATHRRRTFVLTCIFNDFNGEISRRLADLYASHKEKLRRVRLTPASRGQALNLNLLMTMTRPELEVFKQQLSIFCDGPVTVTERNPVEMLMLAAVILLWGINPVIAKWLLLQGLPPLSLVSIRLIAFALFGTVLYVGWRLRRKRSLARIPKATLPMLPSTVSLAALAFFTYWALVYMPPSLHITILRFNVLLLPLVSLFKAHSLKRRSVLIASLICFVSFAIFLTLPHAIPFWGIGLSLFALLSYLSYSVLIERTLQTLKIDIRYPSLLFQSGLLLGVVGLLLLPFQNITDLWNDLTFPAIFYVLLCVFLPHAFFNAILKRMQFRYITDFFLLEVPIAMLFEILLLNILLPLPMYVLMFGIVLAILLLRWRSLQTMVM